MKIAIYGYGNLGKGVELAVKDNADMELIGIFSARAGSGICSQTGVQVFSANDIFKFEGLIDVLIICSGSADALPELTPKLSERFNVVDSYDCHDKIPEHFEAVDAAARTGRHAALISAGWDPGLFSLARLYFSAVAPTEKVCTFWGRGVSQGHSEAIRSLSGVIDARAYTIPDAEMTEYSRAGKISEYKKENAHRRECFVVADESADRARIESEIKNMKGYFEGSRTDVHFITAEEMRRDHGGLSHGGCVICGGEFGNMEFSLKLASNPNFTGAVLCACARAVLRLYLSGFCGCCTLLDIPPTYLSPFSPKYLQNKLV